MKSPSSLPTASFCCPSTGMTDATAPVAHPRSSGPAGIHLCDRNHRERQEDHLCDPKDRCRERGSAQDRQYAYPAGLTGFDAAGDHLYPFQEKVLEKKENPSVEQTVQTEEKKDDTSIELKDNDDKVRVKIGKIENIENFNVQNMTVTNDD